MNQIKPISDNLSKLPDDMLMEVAKYLPQQDCMINLVLVSKKLQEIAESRFSVYQSQDLQAKQCRLSAFHRRPFSVTQTLYTCLKASDLEVPHIQQEVKEHYGKGYGRAFLTRTIRLPLCPGQVSIAEVADFGKCLSKCSKLKVIRFTHDFSYYEKNPEILSQVLINCQHLEDIYFPELNPQNSKLVGGDYLKEAQKFEASIISIVKAFPNRPEVRVFFGAEKTQNGYSWKPSS